MIKILIFSLILIFSSTYSIAQIMHIDSVKKAVRIDVRKFTLNTSDFKKFRVGGISEKSDFFKPAISVTSQLVYKLILLV